MSALFYLLRDLHDAQRSVQMLADMCQSSHELVELNAALRGKLESEKQTSAALRSACVVYQTQVDQLQKRLAEYEARHVVDLHDVRCLTQIDTALRQACVQYQVYVNELRKELSAENTKLEDIVSGIYDSVASK